MPCAHESGTSDGSRASLATPASFADQTPPPEPPVEAILPDADLARRPELSSVPGQEPPLHPPLLYPNSVDHSSKKFVVVSKEYGGDKVGDLDAAGLVRRSVGEHRAHLERVGVDAARLGHAGGSAGTPGPAASRSTRGPDFGYAWRVLKQGWRGLGSRPGSRGQPQPSQTLGCALEWVERGFPRASSHPLSPALRRRPGQPGVKAGSREQPQVPANGRTFCCS